MRYVIPIIALVFVLLFPIHSFSSLEGHDYFKVYGGIWNIDSGEALFRISFPAPPYGTVFSELEWNQLDSYAPMIGLKVRPLTYLLAFDLQYLEGDLRHGDGTDADWLEIYLPFSRSRFDTDGDVEYWSCDIDISLYPFAKRPQRTRFEGIIGYFQHENNLRMTNGIQTVPDTGPFPNLDSTFDFHWEGIKTGLSFEHDFIQTPSKGLYGFGIKLTYSRLWQIDYEGEGFWNLRTDWPDRRFFQDGDDGTGYDFACYLFYNPVRSFQVQVGYRAMKVEVEGGSDVIPGIGETYLEQTASSSKGWLINLAYAF